MKDKEHYIEEYTEIDNKQCYGTNNLDLVCILISYDYSPITCIEKDNTSLYYFERIEDFDIDVEHFKLFLNGGLIPWLCMMDEKHNADQMWLDCV